MLKLTVVVPCYDEGEVLPETISRLGETLSALRSAGRIDDASDVLFVDDGSRDDTWTLIEQAALRDPRVHGLKLSRNRGHENALLAGLLSADADAVISVDADLQDDLGAIASMVEAFHGGADIVYGVRRSRTKDSWGKRVSAHAYYRLLRAMGADCVGDHADYRLMSRRAIRALGRHRESNLFLRSIVPTLGFASAVVEYDRNERFAGTSKYSVGKMLQLVLNGIISFSVPPLRVITGIGLVVSLVSLLGAAWAVFAKVSGLGTVPGWTSTVLPIYFLGGIQLLALGIIGEYLTKIYLETKRRPRFFVDKRIRVASEGSAFNVCTSAEARVTGARDPHSWRRGGGP